MLPGGNLAQQILVQLGVAGQLFVGRLRSLFYDVLESRMLTQTNAQPHGIAQPLAVEIALKVPVIQRWLHGRVGRSQAQLTGALGQVQNHQDPDPQGVHALPSPVHPLRGKGLHQQLDIVSQVRPFGGYAGRHLDSGSHAIQRKPLMGFERDVDDRMVSQILPHSGKVMDNRNAELLQLVGRPDARKHQGLGRSDGPGTQDYFIAFDGESFAAAFHLNAGGSIALEEYPADHGVGPYCQVEPVPAHVQIAQSRAPPDAIRIVHRAWAHARGVGKIVVRAVGDSFGAARLEKRPLVGQPVLGLEPVDDYWPVGVMEVVGAEIGIGFNHPQVLEQVGERPLVVSLGGPGIVVLGHPAEKHLPIDGAGPAGNLAAGHHHGRRSGGPPARKLPVVVARHDIGGGCVTELDLVGQLFEVGVIGAGLDQQHRLAWVFAQPGGHNRPGRTGAEDDVVVLHFRNLL